MKLKMSYRVFPIFVFVLTLVSLALSAKASDPLMIPLDSASAVAGIQCEAPQNYRQSLRYDCKVASDQTPEGAKNFHFLSLKGSFKDSSFDHAYLMAREGQDGLIKDVLNEVDQTVHGQTVIKLLLNCYTRRILQSVSGEFREALSEAFKGYAAASHEKAIPLSLNEDRLNVASISAELGNIFFGLLHDFDEDKSKTIATVARSCGPFGVTVDMLERGAIGALRGLGKLGKSLNPGCLGFVVPSQSSKLGLMHARNFDYNFEKTWNQYPIIVLAQEPGYYKYIAAGSAGLIYPGGVSGMNEKQISVSLHQLSTANYRTGFVTGEGVVAPFLQQRILREAKNIDEAIAIVKDSKRFAAWTILISDGKTQESASIEFSGNKVQVARRFRAQPMGQSNHFVGSHMKDQFVTESVGKLIESEARLLSIQNQLVRLGLNEKGADLSWMMDRLAGHIDPLVGFRSFGRTASKAYTIMSTVAIPERNQFWVSVGDRKPASHSTFVGVQVDWSSGQVSLVGKARTQQYTNIPNWEDSLQDYIQAKLLYEAKNFKDSLISIRLAEQKALADKIFEVPYYYMEARILQSMEEHDQAFALFDLLWTSWQKVAPDAELIKQIGAEHPFLESYLKEPGSSVFIMLADDMVVRLALNYLISTKQVVSSKRWEQTKLPVINQARLSLKHIIDTHKPIYGGKFRHKDLTQFENEFTQLERNETPSLRALNFVVIE